MKKILFILVMIAGAFSIQAQSSASIDKMVEREMDALVKIVSYENDALKFNTNQTAKLERVLFKKCSEIATLRTKGSKKGDYLKQHNSINEKYEEKIKTIMSAPQKIAYQKNKKKQIKLMKDSH